MQVINNPVVVAPSERLPVRRRDGGVVLGHGRRAYASDALPGIR